MGSLGHVTTIKLFIMIPVVCIGTILSVYSIKALNLLLLGDSYAQTMGLNIRRPELSFYINHTAYGNCNRILWSRGVSGLAVPHVARMLFNNADHRTLLPGSILLGIIAMLACDIVAKTLILPVNCITALLGIPVIIWVVYKNLRVA
ncbi:MAG: iron chelate uptake ABC transporter family permease subunit [Butyricimonas faecalis]